MTVRIILKATLLTRLVSAVGLVAFLWLLYVSANVAWSSFNGNLKIQEAVLELIQSAALWVYVLCAFATRWLEDRNAMPRHPGFAWRYKVLNLVRELWRKERRLQSRANDSRQDQALYELQWRRRKLEDRYFYVIPTNPEPPKRRFKKLSAY